MYTQTTYQDWLATPLGERLELMHQIVEQYKVSSDFKHALQAQRYFESNNDDVSKKVVLRAKAIDVTVTDDATGREVHKRQVANTEVAGARVASNFFFRFVTQQNQYLLGNGATIGGKNGESVKAALGLGFDTALQQIGESALVHGCCWGYWNLDHLEIIKAAADNMSGFVALVDEMTSQPRVGLQFWQLTPQRPMYIRLFEEDGLSVYKYQDSTMTLMETKRAYVQRVSTDALGSEITAADNYGRLPLVPLYANPERRSELTMALKSKIDAYDIISSDFVDNLEQANDVYWVLNNFGGSSSEAAAMLAEIHRLKAVMTISDGSGSGSSAEPHSFEVPYAARDAALKLIEAAMYKDFMGLSLDEITGGSLTNVAIRAAETNLTLKCDRYEWQVFAFVQQLLKLLGHDVEQISFVRRSLSNASEVVADIALMREDIDQETALRLNPYIAEEDIPGIMERTALEKYSGTARLPEEEDGIDGSGDEDSIEDRDGDAEEY